MSRRTLFSLLLILVLAACNYPGYRSFGAATPTPTAVPPTATLPPTVTAMPSNTPPPPPTDTPLPPPPTQPPAVQPSPEPTRTRAPTAKPEYPAPGSKYIGAFDGGKIVFRVADNGKEVTLKEVVLSGAVCSNGKKVNTRYDYVAAVYFPIENNGFNITMEDVTVGGVFYTPPIGATGSIHVQVKTGKIRCGFGPVSWTATLTP